MFNYSGDDQLQDEETYMNSRQREFFRHRLKQWRKRLQLESRQSLQQILDNAPQVGDLLDQSVHDANRVMDFLARKRLERTICQIDAAPARLNDGPSAIALKPGRRSASNACSPI